MGQKDISEKTFISLNDVFADIFNVLVFKGTDVIEEDSLTDVVVRSQYKAEDGKLHEEERDAAKLWKHHNFNLVLFGVENQTEVDGDMPFRVIGYDGAGYRSQMLGNKAERFPVVTIILYFGKKIWNKPLNLKGCFSQEVTDTREYQMLEEYVNDYKCHVFDIPRLSKETVKQFQSDFHVVAEYFVNTYTNKEYVPEERVIRHVDEFLKLMSVLTGDNQYETMAKSEDFQKIKKKGGITMCNVLEYHKAEGRAEGRAEGKEEGKAEGRVEERNTLIIRMYENKLTSEQIASITGLSIKEVEYIRDSAANEEC